MKRYFYISFACFYLVLCTGVNVYAHFCGSKLSSVSAFIDHAGCCCDEGAEDINTCCNETVKTLKITQEHRATQALSWGKMVFISSIEPIFVPRKMAKNVSSTPILHASHSPPDLGVPIFIWNCVFII